MRSASSTLRPLVLAGFCLLAAASGAEANPPPVLFPTLPSYYPGGRVAPGVYVYPQVVTPPRYYAVYPPYSYGYPTGWYGGYRYTTGSFYYWDSPRWGASYYYTNPNFYYWYRAR
jgi:hypothetical protein